MSSVSTVSDTDEKPSASAYWRLCFYIVFCVSVGFMIGLTQLAVVAPLVVKKIPEPDAKDFKPKAVYVLLGNSSGGNSFKDKEGDILKKTPGEYVLTEAELNAWSRKTLASTPPPAAKPKQGEPPPPPPVIPGKKTLMGVSITSEPPNFRVLKDMLQVAVSFDIKWGNEEGQQAKVLYVAKGVIAYDGAYRFKTSSASLGSGRLPGALASALVDPLVMSFFTGTEYQKELANAWMNLRKVDLQEGSLGLLMR